MEQTAMNLEQKSRHSRPSPVQYMHIGNWCTNHSELVLQSKDEEAWKQCQQDLGFEFPISSFVNIRSEMGFAKRKRNKRAPSKVDAHDMRSLAASVCSVMHTLNILLHELKQKSPGLDVEQARVTSTALRLSEEWRSNRGNNTETQ